MDPFRKYIIQQIIKQTGKIPRATTLIDNSVAQLKKRLINAGEDISKYTNPKQITQFFNKEISRFNQIIKQKTKNLGLMDPNKNIFMKKEPFSGWTPKVVEKSMRAEDYADLKEKWFGKIIANTDDAINTWLKKGDWTKADKGFTNLSKSQRKDFLDMVDYRIKHGNKKFMKDFTDDAGKFKLPENLAGGGRAGFQTGGLPAIDARMQQTYAQNIAANEAQRKQNLIQRSTDTAKNIAQRFGDTFSNVKDKSLDWLADKSGYTQHNINNQLLRNALADKQITEQQYKLMGGYDVAQQFPKANIGNVQIGGTSGDIGLASLLYNAIKSGINIADPSNVHAQYGRFAAPESIALNMQGAKGLSDADLALYNKIIKGQTQQAAPTAMSEKDFYNSFWGVPWDDMPKWYHSATPEQEALRKKHFPYSVHMPHQMQRAVDLGVYTPYEGPTEYAEYLKGFAGGGLAGLLGEPTYQDDNHRVPYKDGKTGFSGTFDEWRAQNPSREELLSEFPFKNIGDFIGPIPQYDERGDLIPIFSKTGKQQIEGAPEGITSDKEVFNLIVGLDIPITEKINILGDIGFFKYRDRIEKDGQELFLDDPAGSVNKNIGIGYEDDGLSGSFTYSPDTKYKQFQISKKFNKGGFTGSDIYFQDKFNEFDFWSRYNNMRPKEGLDQMIQDYINSTKMEKGELGKLPPIPLSALRAGLGYLLKQLAGGKFNQERRDVLEFIAKPGKPTELTNKLLHARVKKKSDNLSKKIAEEMSKYATKHADGGRVPLEGGKTAFIPPQPDENILEGIWKNMGPWEKVLWGMGLLPFEKGGRVDLAGGGLAAALRFLMQKYGKDVIKFAKDVKPSKKWDTQKAIQGFKDRNPEFKITSQAGEVLDKRKAELIKKFGNKTATKDEKAELLKIFKAERPQDIKKAEAFGKAWEKANKERLVPPDMTAKGIDDAIAKGNLQKEFPGITDDLVNKILADDNPQRIAEVKATLKEALKMQEKGMGPDEIINIFKKKPTKHASGGRVSLSSGGVAGMLGE